MREVKIKLYKLNELGEEAQGKVISEHLNFLLSVHNPEMFDGFNNEEGYTHENYEKDLEENDWEQIRENIEINEYLFFQDGEMAEIRRYMGGHEKAGTVELSLYGEIFEI